PVVYEEDDDVKLTCNSKRKFKEYKELLMYHSLDSLLLMVEDLEKKKDRSKIEEFILKHSKEVLKISDFSQIQKIKRIRNNDALLESRREAMDQDDLSPTSSFDYEVGFCDFWGESSASPPPKNPTTTSASPAPNPITTSASPAPNTTTAEPPLKKQRIEAPPQL
ncbi:MAG: hypothetical protein ACKN9I_07925, partial [Alphaproteobacteria bacterium]